MRTSRVLCSFVIVAAVLTVLIEDKHTFVNGLLGALALGMQWVLDVAPERAPEVRTAGLQ